MNPVKKFYNILFGDCDNGKLENKCKDERTYQDNISINVNATTDFEKFICKKQYTSCTNLYYCDRKYYCIKRYRK